MPTSYQRSIQSVAGFSRSAEFHSVQWFPSTLYQSASQLVTRPPAVPVPVPVAEPAPFPCQQSYQLFPAPVRRLPQRFPETCYMQTAASSYPTQCSMPARNPVAIPPEISQFPDADPKSLTDEYPFSYSIAKELPHIFGNVDDDEVLERPLTPSFEPVRDSLSLESDQSVESSSHSSEDFADCVQPSRYDSCCFASYEASSLLPISDFSCGFVSKGRNLRFYRQD